MHVASEHKYMEGRRQGGGSWLLSQDKGFGRVFYVCVQDMARVERSVYAGFYTGHIRAGIYRLIAL